MRTITSARGTLAAQRPIVAAVAAIATLSALSSGFWGAFVPAEQYPLFLALQLTLLLGLAALTVLSHTLKPLRGYVLILSVILLLLEVALPLARRSPLWLALFGTPQASYLLYDLGDRLLKAVAALIVIAILYAMGGRRRELFLARGQPAAAAEPVRWLGMRKPAPWTRFGGVVALCGCVALVLVMGLLIRPSLGAFVAALPLLPIAWLSAGLNAWFEEVIARVAPVSRLLPVVGKQPALILAAAWFGLGHYHGSIPSGLPGVMVAGLLGWLFGKALVETRGIAMP